MVRSLFSPVSGAFYLLFFCSSAVAVCRWCILCADYTTFSKHCRVLNRGRLHHVFALLFGRAWHANKSVLFLGFGMLPMPASIQRPTFQPPTPSRIAVADPFPPPGVTHNKMSHQFPKKKHTKVGQPCGWIGGAWVGMGG